MLDEAQEAAELERPVSRRFEASWFFSLFSEFDGNGWWQKWGLGEA